MCEERETVALGTQDWDAAVAYTTSQHILELVLLDYDKARPRNTTATYRKPKADWEDTHTDIDPLPPSSFDQIWCKETYPPIPEDWPQPYDPQHILPGALVQESKLVRYLFEKVMYQPPSKGRRVTDQKKRQERQGLAQQQQQQQQEEQEEEAGNITVSVPGQARAESPSPDRVRPGASFFSRDWSQIQDYQLSASVATVQNHISAIMDLYTRQCTQGINPAPNPRAAALKAVWQTCRRRQAEQQKGEGTDRLINSIKDIYTPAHAIALTQHVWQDYKTAARVGIALRTGTDFHFADKMLLRFDNRTQLELGDIFRLNIPRTHKDALAPAFLGNNSLSDTIPRLDAKTHNFALCCLFTKSKTNQEGDHNYTAVYRHRSPYSCAVGQLAFFFFWRWQVEEAGEQFPNLAHPEQWYRIKVLLRQSPKDPRASIDYKTHCTHIKKLYGAVGITGSKLTHAPRKASAQTQELRGTSEGQIRRAGLWALSDSMISAYLSTLAYDFMRSAAGFDPHNDNSYFLPRATVQPPVELRSKVWPMLDFYRDCYEAEVKRAQEWGNPLPDQHRLAHNAVFELLDWLRDVLLQDAAFLIGHSPDHPLFQDPVFKSPHWQPFADKVLRAQEQLQPLTELEKIKETIPTVSAGLETIYHTMAATNRAHEEMFRELRKEIRDVKGMVEAQKDQQWQMEIKATLTPKRKSPPSVQITHQYRPLGQPHLGPTKSAAKAKAGHAAAAPPPTTPPQRGPGARTANAAAAAAAAKASPIQSSPTAPGEPEATAAAAEAVTGKVEHQFDFPRNLVTVMDIFKAWHHGIGGFPGVLYLTETFGPGWKKRSERNYFAIRQDIYTEICTRATSHRIPLEAAAKDMEQERLTHKSTTLDNYGKYCKGLAKQRTVALSRLYQHIH